MPEMADDEGDGLGMLVLDEGEQGLGLDALEEAERRPLHLGLDLPDDVGRPIGIEGLLQQPLGLL